MSFNRSVYSFLSACLLVGSIATLPAQTPRFPMEYYTVEDGLPDNDCYHMIQDHLGYIWIGTKLGLSRFDGYEFKNYELPLLDSVGSLTQAIVFIKEDKAGNLWFGANKGLYHFDRALNKFHFLPLADSLIDENSLVHYIFEDKKGRIWTVSGPENHLHRWDPQSQVFVAMYLASAGKERVKVGKPNALADHAPIVEDEKGQIWVGTMGAGLAFYDPQKDELTPVHPTKEAWPSDTLYSLLCDRQQTLWVGTAKGLAHYDAEGKILLPFSGGDPGQGQPVWGLQQDRQGGIWLQHTFSLMRLKPENGFGKEYFRLPEIGFDQGIVLGRMKYFVWIGEDLAGNLYWANPLNHHQFFQYDLQADSVKTFVHEFAGKPRNWGRNYDALYQTGLLDRSGLIWLGYNAGLLKARNRDAHFFTKKSDIQEDVPLFAEDPSGNVWVAANQSWLFNPENQRLIDFEAVVPGLMPIDNLPTGLLHFDRRSNLWLEKQGNFIQITFPDNQQTFVNLALGKKAKASSIQNTPLHLPEYAVDGDLKTRWSSEWSDPQWLELDLGKREYVDHFILYWEACFASQYEIQLSDDGQTWRTAFTNTNGEGGEESISLRQWTRFLRIRGTQRSTQWCYSIWEWEVYGNSPQKENIVLLSDMRGQFVTSFLEDRQGMIWLGTSGIGLVRYDHRSGQYTHYPFLEWQEQISPDILNIPKIYEDRNGLFWLSQANDIFSRAYEYPEGRIFLFDKQSEKLSQFLPPLENAAEVRYKKLWGEDRQGFVWISGTTGIYRYRSSTNEINHYLPRASVTSFLEDDQGRFWVGSANKGLYALDPKKESVRNYRMQDGLVFDGVRTLRQDGKGHIWIGTEKGGLSCFYPEEERFENYNEADGLFGDKIQSSFKDSQGRLYFGGPGGFSFFDPDQLQSDTTQAQLVISDLKINNQTVNLGEENSPLFQAISQTQSLNLAHDQNVITLGFTALHYNQSEKNRYQVRLLGLDTTWVDLGTQRSMNYAGLSPGSYTFQVKGSNADGVWSEEPTELQIIIRPPWWRSTLAYLVYVLLLLTGIYAFIRWRTDSLRRQRELLRKRVSEQTQELRVAKEAAESANEAKSTFLSTVSHELRTPLTSIIGFTKLNQKNLLEKLIPAIDPSDHKAKRAALKISKNLSVVSSEGDRLTTLINELLDLAKIESGKVEWKMVELQPKELIERAVNATSALFEQKPSLNLITDVPEDLPNITGDRDRLLQVLINLISNAVKFTDEGLVRIRCERREERGEMVFAVEDTGSGIPADQLDKVFERFQQVEDNQTGKPKGTGLGLPICKEIVAHHGGRIWVESELGKGSNFLLSLPITI